MIDTLKKNLRTVFVALLFVVAAPLAPISVCHADVAPDPPAKPAAQQGQGGWEDVNGGMMVQPGEGFPATTLVGTAYGFIWVMVAGFVLMTWRRTGAVERELEALRRRVSEGAARQAGASK